jgi:uncharacterized membrane protein YqaE (UPF0057 family)
MTSRETHEKIKQRISAGEYSLFDKIMYGGLGYGYFCIPSDVFKWIFTGLFPPLGIFIHFFGKLGKTFPYITKQNLKNLISHIDDFIIAFIGTMLFYIPGLMYVINIFNKSPSAENLTNTKEKLSDTNNTNDDGDGDDDGNDDGDGDGDGDEYEPTNIEKLRETLFDD